MDYSLILGGIAIYLLGATTVFVLFHKNILNDVVFFNSFQKSSKGALNKLWYEFYARLSSTVDLKVYENSIEVAELERKRIGLDIHDEIAAHLSSLYIDLQVIRNRNEQLSAHTEKMLDDMRGKIKHIIEALRRIINGLVPATLEHQSLDEALLELCRKKDNTKGTSVLFRTSGQSTALESKYAEYIYRIVQELVTNALKHSKAWHIFVTLLWTETELKVTVRDNGKGMKKYDDTEINYGIKGIFIRSQILGAVSKFNSSSAGIEFELALPLGKTMKKKD